MTSLFFTPLGVEYSRYDVKLVDPASGKSCAAEVTWDPCLPSKGRRLVRVNESDLRDAGFLGLVRISRTAELLDKIKQSGRLGNVQFAKGLVLAIDANVAPQGLAVAVHHFGPVPVVLVAHSLFEGGRPHLILDGVMVDVDVGIYPDLNQANVALRQAGAATVEECLRSYRVGLDVIFRKYLEDVGEDFRDIENSLSTRAALRRSRHFEETLGGSVDGKLDQIRMHFKDDKSRLHGLAKALWDNYGVDIVLASHARLFALFMLNQWYKLVGIKAKVSKYRDKWAETENRAQKWFGERYDLLVAGPTDLGLLSKAFHAFGQQDGGALLRSEEAATGWVKSFISFARWILALKGDELHPAEPRVFFSGRHGEETTKLLLKEVVQHYALNQPTKARRLRIATVENEPGQEIGHLVRRRIAFSHGLIAAIPSGSEDDLTWVIREIEHADLREKFVAPFVESGADSAKVQNAFATFTEYLSSRDDRIDLEKRQQRVVALVSKIAYATFRNGETWHVSPELARELDRIAADLRDQMVFDLVLGLINLFQRQDRRIIVHSMKHTVNRSRPKRTLCELLARDLAESKVSRVEGQFARTWGRIKDRKLEIDDSEYQLLTMPKKGHYQSNLPSILRKLRPELSDLERVKLHDRIIQAIPGGPGAI